MQLLVLGWAETGRSDKRADKLRNDIIDVNFVAFATFFDDFLTNDRMARELYLQTKVALNAIVPSDLMP